MEKLGSVMTKLQGLKSTIYQNSYISPQEKSKYECEICQDIEFILNPETGGVRPCECQEIKKYNRILKNSGISEAFRRKTLSNFTLDGKNQLVKVAYNMATNYTKNFKAIEQDRHNSITFLGKPGSGKTHLTIAIANQLMEQRVAVLYMQYREAITQIKQCITDEENYQKILSKYKQARVLMIDDLFKGKITESDLNIMFEIINHRYLNGQPVIISSEFMVNDLLKFDEALGSRIVEMSKGRIVEFQGPGLNHRLAVGK